MKIFNNLETQAWAVSKLCEQNPDITVEEAEQLLQTFYRAFPEVRKWAEVAHQAREQQEQLAQIFGKPKGVL